MRRIVITPNNIPNKLSPLSSLRCYRTFVALSPVVVILALLLTSLQAFALNPLKAPLEEDAQIAKKIIGTMRANPRGPYKQINWYCKDGSVKPPKSYACKDHGGGNQHAQYSNDRETLAAKGVFVGTIYTAMAWSEFWGGDKRNTRMRQLPLERYLIDIDDGWVLHKAKYYRGYVQIEDEAAAGKNLLLKLLSDTPWIKENYVLLRELARVIPHDGGEDITRSVRRLSQDIAEKEPAFEPVRIQIHTAPSQNSATDVQHWIDRNAATSLNEVILPQARELVKQLRALYGSEGRQLRLKKIEADMMKTPVLKPMAGLLKPSVNETSLAAVARIARVLIAIRQAVESTIPPSAKLLLLDGLVDLEAELSIYANQVLSTSTLTRLELLSLASDLVVSGYGGGVLSAYEFDSLRVSLDTVLTQEQIPLHAYLSLTRQLNLVGPWAVGSVRNTFAEALVVFASIDSRAINFIDDILRASPVLPLAEVTRQLAFDAQTLAGVDKTLFSSKVPDVLVLNPGVAFGTLRVLSEADLSSDVQLKRTDIVVLPQTVSELSPVAGVLTQGEGNMLSHVQLLARNFGIPNVSISQTVEGLLKKHDNKEVLFVAGSDGSVMVQLLDNIDGLAKQFIAEDVDMGKLNVPTIDDRMIRPIDLEDLNRRLSGHVVGPKAANLGELNRMFPGRVAPAMALPFGFFLQEVNRYPSTQWEELAAAYKQFRNGDINQETLSLRIQKLHGALSQMTVSEDLKKQLRSRMKNAFGDEGSYGLFLRSDTNVEDLPGFTGAGLSETVPNVVGFDEQLRLIPIVWASVLSPRAIAWRANLLSNPEHVFPSVLLMKSVNASKSGVLITTDLVNRQSGLTVSTAWGVGGAVAGEVAETLVLHQDGSEQLISEAKAAYQRRLPSSGGVQWVKAVAGAVLTSGEKQQLRALAAEVHKKYESSVDDAGQPMPWDIEFGFVEGKLTLFQIRPLVERGPARADRYFSSVRGTTTSLNATVPLKAKVTMFRPQTQKNPMNNIISEGI